MARTPGWATPAPTSEPTQPQAQPQQPSNYNPGGGRTPGWGQPQAPTQPLAPSAPMPGQQPSYWEDPAHVARYYNAIRTAPPGSVMPDWLDAPAVNAIYGWMQLKNQANGPDWTTWQPLAQDDPALFTVKGMKTPPPNALLPWEANYVDQSMKDNAPAAPVDQWAATGAQQEPDWNKFSTWQQIAMSLLTPQPTATNRPNLSRATAAGVSGLMSGMGVLFAGGLLTGATALIAPPAVPFVGGAVVTAASAAVVAKAGEAYLQGGNMMPALDQILAPTMWIPWAFEAGAGLVDQVRAEGLAKIIKDLPSAAQAGRLGYETGTFGLTEVPNILAKTEKAIRVATGQPTNVGGLEAAQPGQAWKYTQGYSNPVKMVNAQGELLPEGEAIVKQARERIAAGEEPEKIIAEYTNDIGDAAMLADFVGVSVFNPLILAGYMEGKLGGGVAKLAGKPALAEAFAHVTGNPMVDWSQAIPGVGQLVSAITKQKVSQGITGAFGQYRNMLEKGPGFKISKPGEPAVYKPQSEADWIDRKIGGLNAEGQSKELIPRVATGNKLLDYLTEQSNLTPEAQAGSGIKNLYDHIVRMLFDADNTKGTDVQRAEAAHGVLMKLAGIDPVVAGDVGETFYHGSIAASIATSLKEVMNDPKLAEMLTQYVSKSHQDSIAYMKRMAQIAGLEPKDFLQRLYDNPAEVFAVMKQRAADSPTPESKTIVEAIKSGQLTSELFADQFATFTGIRKGTGEGPKTETTLPWAFEDFRTRLAGTAFDLGSKNIIKTFNIKADSAVNRLAGVLKTAQSMLLLDLNPGYAVNNTVNDVFTRAFQGVGWFLTPQQRARWWDEFGGQPGRVGEGIGAAGNEALGNATYAKSMSELRDVARGDGALVKLVRDMNKARSKIGVFSKLSGKIEASESSQAYTIGTMQMWDTLWRKGKGITQLPPQLETRLAQIDPRLPDRIYSIIASGHNRAQIEAALWDEVNTIDINSELTRAVTEVGGDHANVIRQGLVALGVIPEIKAMLSEKQKPGQPLTPQDLAEVFSMARQKTKDLISHKLDNEIIDHANVIKDTIANEGFQAVPKMFSEMQQRYWDKWVQHIRDMEDFWDQVKTLNPDQKNAAWRQKKAADQASWSKLNDFDLQVYSGILKSMGIDADKMVGLIDQRIQARRDAFAYRDQALEELFSGRNSKLDYKTVQEGINKVFDQANIQVKAAQEGIDLHLADMFGPENHDTVLNLRHQIAAMQDQVEAATQKFIKDFNATDLATQTATSRNAAWNKWDREVRLPLINKLMGAEVQFGEELKGMKGKETLPQAPVQPAPAPAAPIEGAPAAETIVDPRIQAIITEAERVKNIAKATYDTTLDRNLVMAQFKDAFGASQSEMSVVGAVLDMYVEQWSKRTGRKPAEWYVESIAAVEKGGEAAGLAQLANPQNWYYSQLSRAVEAIPQERMTVGQLKGAITKGGVKADEMKWTGLDDFLASKTDDAKITKAEVSDFLKQNEVTVSEVQLPNEPTKAYFIAYKDGPTMGSPYPTEADARAAIHDTFPGWPDRTDLEIRVGKGDAETRSFVPTQYHNYTLPGGENYRELLFKMPETPKGSVEAFKAYQSELRQKYGNDEAIYDRATPEELSKLDILGKPATPKVDYASPHFGTEGQNLLAHVRFDSRIDADGKRVLFVEEVQSDWHQAGREKGYQGQLPQGWKVEETQPELGPRKWQVLDENGTQKYSDTTRQGAIDGATQLGNAVPPAPFAKTWDMLVMKRMIRWAAENGYDKVAWTTGEQQAARYNLAQYVDDIQWVKSPQGGDVTLAMFKDGKATGTQYVAPDKLSDYIGKDAAKVIVGDPATEGHLRGDNLQVGGQGMKTFYDLMLPSNVDKYVKKWGAKVGETTINVPNDTLARGTPTQYKNTVHSFDVTQTMKDSAMQGQPLFQADRSVLSLAKDYGIPTATKTGAPNDKYIVNLVKKYGGDTASGIKTVSDITPDMARTAFEARRVAKGLPAVAETPLPADVPAKGSVQFLEDGRAVIRAFKGADVSTMFHELSHIFRRDLSTADLQAVAEWSGLKDANEYRTLQQSYDQKMLQQGQPEYDRYVAAEEKFARGFERWLAGEIDIVPPKVAGVFAQLKTWMLQVYGKITGTPIDVQITPEVRAVFERMLFDENRSKAASEIVKSKFDLANQQTAAQPTQPTMFTNGQDLPLMSGTAQNAQGEVFAPQETGQQPAMIDMRGQLPEIKAKVATGNAEGTPLFEAKPAETVKSFPDLPQNPMTKAYNLDYIYTHDGLSSMPSWIADEFKSTAAYLASDITMPENNKFNSANQTLTVGHGMGGWATPWLELQRENGLTTPSYAQIQNALDAWGKGEQVRAPSGKVITAKWVKELKGKVVNEMGVGQAGGPVDPRLAWATGAKDEAVKSYTQWLDELDKIGRDTSGLVDELFKEDASAFTEYYVNYIENHPEANTLFQKAAPPPVKQPLDSTPTSMPTGKIMDESWNKDFQPVLDALERNLQRQLGEPALKMGAIDPQTRTDLNSYLKQVYNVDMPGAKLASQRYGESQRDMSLLNYNRRYGADNSANLLFPYQFWYTRTMMNWAKRMIDKPAIFSFYANIRDKQRKYEQQGVPSRFRGKMKIAAPWLPDWASPSLYYDPLKQAFPFDQIAQPLEQYNVQISGRQQQAVQILRDAVTNGETTQEEATQAMTDKTGYLWDAAYQKASAEADDSISNPVGLVSMMMTPAMYATIPWNLTFGKKEQIGPTPVLRTSSSIQTALQGSPLEGLGNLIGMIGAPERWVRGKMGLEGQDYGEFSQFYVERQIGAMAAEGSVDPKDALQAFIDHQGPVYDQALQRVKTEQAIKTPGITFVMSLRKALEGGGSIMDVTGTLAQTLFPAGIISKGEIIARGQSKEYNDAWKAKDAGDTEAITKFFDDHPEYSVRLAQYKDPEQRLRNFLVSEIWDGYDALSGPNKGKVKDGLGQQFIDTFLDPTLADSTAVDISTLAYWARYMGGRLPNVPETQEVKNQPMYQSQPLEMLPTGVNTAVQAYWDERDKLFPLISEKQSAYYDNGKSKAILTRFPELKQYWDWKAQYTAQHPEVQAYLNDQTAAYNAANPSTTPAYNSTATTPKSSVAVDFSGFDSVLMRQVLGWAYNNSPLTQGAKDELYRLWQQAGRPGNTFQDYLDAVHTSMLGK